MDRVAAKTLADDGSPVAAASTPATVSPLRRTTAFRIAKRRASDTAEVAVTQRKPKMKANLSVNLVHQLQAPRHPLHQTRRRNGDRLSKSSKKD